MTDKLEVGQIAEGKVTGIQPYGAFVALNDELQGLIHISEITHGYVKNINDYLSVGDEVTVKILNIDMETNKVSLSIRATEERPEKRPNPQQQKQTKTLEESNVSGFNTLKHKLEEWIEQSKERESSFKN